MIVRSLLWAFASLIIGATLATMAHADGGNVQPGDADYPATNPTPTKFIRIHGTIDGSFDMSFSIVWNATNPVCKYTTNQRAGATAPYSTITPLPAQRNGEKFDINLAVDGKLAGRCGWKFVIVYLVGKDGFLKSLIQTNTLASDLGPSPNGIVDLRCDTKQIGTRPQLWCSEGPENKSSSVRRGVLWWRPETTDVEVHVRRGRCRYAQCSESE